MAIIECPECNSKISTRADVCLRCGLPMSDIYICPKCNNGVLKSDGLCKKCGLSIDKVTNENTIIEKTKSVSEEDIIISVFKKVISQMSPADNFDHYFISGGGRPLPTANDEQNARNVFNIPNNVRVYFVTSANIFGGIKIGGKGFAITTKGIYYTDNNKNRGLITIQEFMNSYIYESPYITIGNHAFNATNKEKLLKMLKDLQKELISRLNSMNNNLTKEIGHVTPDVQEGEKFDYLSAYYRESTVHILNAKEYFYLIKKNLEEACYMFQLESRIMYSSITERDCQQITALYNKFKSCKSKFEKIYGTVRIDLEKTMKKGIYFQKIDKYGEIIDYGGDIEAIISYISYKDIEFEGEIKKRINSISKFIYDNRDVGNNFPFLFGLFWSAFFIGISELIRPKTFNLKKLEDNINYITYIIDELYKYC